MIVCTRECVQKNLELLPSPPRRSNFCNIRPPTAIAWFFSKSLRHCSRAPAKCRYRWFFLRGRSRNGVRVGKHRTRVNSFEFRKDFFSSDEERTWSSQKTKVVAIFPKNRLFPTHFDLFRSYLFGTYFHHHHANMWVNPALRPRSKGQEEDGRPCTAHTLQHTCNVWANNSPATTLRPPEKKRKKSWQWCINRQKKGMGRRRWEDCGGEQTQHNTE